MIGKPPTLKTKNCSLRTLDLSGKRCLGEDAFSAFLKHLQVSTAQVHLMRSCGEAAVALLPMCGMSQLVYQSTV